MQKELTEEHLKEILKEQCGRVGADYDKMDFKKPLWYCDYEWTEEEQTAFQEWVADFLVRNKYVKKNDKYYRSGKGVKMSMHLASKLILYFGWKTKQTK